MRLQSTFSPEFEALYNQLSNTDKGKEFLRMEGIDREVSLDIGAMSKKYHQEKLSDLSINQNSNSNGIDSRGPNSYAAEVVKGLLKLEGYFLLHHYSAKRYGIDRANELIEAIWSGDVYFHDASGAGIQEPYCVAYSTSMLMNTGRPYGQLHSVAPKRAKSYVAQVIETTMDLSQCFAGAVAVSDFLVNYSWYAQREQLSDKAIIDDLQSFCHTMNNQFRVSAESPFTNLSIFDKENLHKLFEHYRYPDGSEVDYDYVMKIQTLFGEWFAKGDPVSQLPYRFPIVTINICRDENGDIIDPDFMDWAARVNLGTGCFNIYVNSGNKIASCCRLVNDRERMQFKSDSFGNGGLNLGSHRVVTLNLPRLALRAKKDKAVFMRELNRVLGIAKDLLIVHREDILTKRIEAGFLKFFKPLGWFNLNHFFSTIGIVGVFEMCELMDTPIKTMDGSLNGGVEFSEEVLKAIERFAIDTSNETHKSFNVEQVPGETAASKFALKDKLMFGDDKQPFVMYSNQFIPLVVPATIPERIQINGRLMDLMSGGAIVHLNLQEKIPDVDVMKHIMMYAVKHGASHFAINYAFGTCERGHTTVCGNTTTCPVCGAFVKDHLTRIVGYFTKVSSWSTVRREWEFPKRDFSQTFKEE